MASPYGFASARVRALRFALGLASESDGYRLGVQSITDEVRHLNARAASHGYGAGQIEASRLIDGWSAEELDQHSVEILGQVDLAQAYAQAAPSGYDDYVSRLAAAGETPTEEAKVAYQAGFDIGFSASLVEGVARVTGLRDSPRETQSPSGLEDAPVPQAWA
jgi:hypothetical protein